jgi:hypothetical protein
MKKLTATFEFSTKYFDGFDRTEETVTVVLEIEYFSNYYTITFGDQKDIRFEDYIINLEKYKALLICIDQALDFAKKELNK